MFEDIHLELEQRDLLKKLVEALRSQPPDQRQPIQLWIARSIDGTDVWFEPDFVKGSNLRPSLSDLHRLRDAGLLLWTPVSKDMIELEISSLGSRFYEYVTTPQPIDAKTQQRHILAILERSPQYVRETDIAKELQITDDEAEAYLDLLDERGLIELLKTDQGYLANLNGKGHIAFKDPTVLQSNTFSANTGSDLDVSEQMAHPTAFISYAWENESHRQWVITFATRLRSDGVDVRLDRWHAAPGDQLPLFMERAVRDNDLVIIICTPEYKRKSDTRQGGVGYEGDIMTAEVFADRPERKFVPILRRGTESEAVPTWLRGRYYVDLRGEPFPEEHYQDLLASLHNVRSPAPPLGPVPMRRSHDVIETATQSVPEMVGHDDEPISITGILVDQVTAPRNDDTPRSALYKVPFGLSRVPSDEWTALFVETWDRPPQFSTMHRPGIARVIGSSIVLDGTTIEEVERYHRDTLQLVVERVNELAAERELQLRRRKEAEEEARRQHEEKVRDIAKRIRFG